MRSAYLLPPVSAWMLTRPQIVDYTIWLLFNQRGSKSKGYRGSHLLCQGYERGPNVEESNRPQPRPTTIPGLTCRFPNHSVDSLKSPAWGEVFRLLGKNGERIMLDMLLDCSLFSAIENGQGNFVQLSGIPLAREKPLSDTTSAANLSSERTTESRTDDLCTAGKISFVRSRLLYARAALNAMGQVRFGLPHIRRLAQQSCDSQR